MRTMLRFMRQLGVRVTGYIDDYLWAARPEKVGELVELVQCVLPAMGWTLNDKCSWDPQARVTYLGLLVDAHEYQIIAPKAKIDMVTRMVKGAEYKVQKAERSG